MPLIATKDLDHTTGKVFNDMSSGLLPLIATKDLDHTTGKEFNDMSSGLFFYAVDSNKRLGSQGRERCLKSIIEGKSSTPTAMQREC